MLKVSKALLVLSSLFCMATTVSAIAEEAPYATYHVKLESNPAQNIIIPIVESPITKDQVAFRLINNTGKEAYFVANNQKYYIPLVSQNTFTIPYVAGEKYLVVDKEGNVLADWQLQTALLSQQTASSAETKAKYEGWGQRIQSLIKSNQVVASSAYQQSQTQPAFTKQPNASYEKGSTVRGYW